MLRRLVNRFRYRRFDDDITEELRFHREMKEQELRARLTESGSAQRTWNSTVVSREMGNELRMRELAREVWVAPGIDALRQDLRDATRLIARRPMLTITSIAALVVGVGAAVTIFALLNALVLRPLPVDRPYELVYLREPSFSYPVARGVIARNMSFANAFAWNLEQYEVRWHTDFESTLVMLVSGSAHTTLGVRPVRGRLLTSADEGGSAAAASAIGVISYGAWQRRFAADPDIVGRIVQIEGVPITIVGVTEPTFFGVAPGRTPELTVPLTLAPRLRARERDVLESPAYAWLHVMARLRSGISLAEADAEFQATWPHVLSSTADAGVPADRRERYFSRRTGLVSGVSGYSSVRNQFREPLMILGALAGLLLLVGCATVAHMLLAGAWGRSRELAVRLALGCSRGRLARQLLIEGLLLAALSAVIAVLVSQWSAAMLVAMLETTDDPVSLAITLDWRLVVFTAIVTVVAAVVCSVAPIAVAVRVHPGPALKSGARQVVSQSGRTGPALVAIQTAFSVVLLIGAALLLRSLGHLLTIDPGFDGTRLLTVNLTPPVSAGSNGVGGELAGRVAADAFYRTMLDRLASVEDVESVGLSLYPQVSNEDGLWTNSAGIDGAPPVDGATTVLFNAVSPGYFSTVGTKLIAGRDFGWTDAQGSERVVIVNESLSLRFFPGQNSLGRRITVGRDRSRQDLTIVGVVTDAKYQRLQETERAIAYLPHRQFRDYASGASVFASIRVRAVTERAMTRIREAVLGVDPRAVARVEWFSDRVRESLVTERLLATLAAAVAGCAFFLACAGLCGLMFQLVARRTREIGVRLALGARATDVRRQVVGQAVVITACGLALGTTMALGFAGWIRGVLHGITPNDPATYVMVAIATLTLAGIMSLLPAHRAATIDPMEALRME